MELQPATTSDGAIIAPKQKGEFGPNAASEVAPGGSTGPGSREGRTLFLSPRRWSVLYLLIALVVGFGLANPSSFLTVSTLKLIADQYSIQGLVGLALLLPLVTGQYDLTVGATAGLAGMMSALVLANVTTNLAVAVIVGLGTGLVVGVINAIVVNAMRIDSFIGTLATSGVVTAVATAISGGNTIAKNVSGSFETRLALANVGGINAPIGTFIVICVILYFALERTPYGRRLYAVGFEIDAARLVGINVTQRRVEALIIAGVIAGGAGVLATAQIGAGDPATGPAYLLPAFSVAFLGATQIRPGRFNVGGLILAVALLGTANIGITIIGGPDWVSGVFDGVILVAAVAATVAKTGRLFGRTWAGRLRRRQSSTVPVS